MINRVKTMVLAAASAMDKHKLKLATAESCTGGGLSYWLTSVPGSSNWFERGFVTYSNEAKIEMLGVRSQTLEAHGAVSEETVTEMAKGALERSHADWSIAITGIAGPDGGTPDKPVGTVWIGIGGRNIPVIAKRMLFNGDRQEVRLASIARSLEMLLAEIEKSRRPV